MSNYTVTINCEKCNGEPVDPTEVRGAMISALEGVIGSHANLPNHFEGSKAVIGFGSNRVQVHSLNQLAKGGHVFNIDLGYSTYERAIILNLGVVAQGYEGQVRIER